MMTSTRRVLAAGAVLAASVGLAPLAQATTTHPGDGITITTADSDTEWTCTLTDVRKDSTGRPWGITAAHCFADHPSSEIRTADGNLIAGPEELSELEMFYNLEDQDKYMDVAFFPLKKDVDVDYNHIYTKPVLDPVWATLSSNPVINNVFNSPWELGEPWPTTENLRGQIACQEGASMGRTCGVIMEADPTHGVVAFVPTIPGDSGGPLHVLGPDGKRHIIGSLTGGPGVFVNVYDNPAGYVETND